MNRPLRRGLVGLAAGVLIVTGTATHAAAHNTSNIDRLRYATGQYFDLGEAVEDGYGQLTDSEGIACIDSGDPEVGAMGIHYVNGDLVGDSEVMLRRPEALIYEPQEDGDMELVAVEYVVFKSAWRAEHPSGRPRLMGQRFHLVKKGNRYGLPAFFELHAWVWQKNPHGMFEDYNPATSCEFAPEP